MIKKINNFSYKSFNKYTGPENDFKRNNIIFGYNGTGKSSLIEGIKREFLKSTNNKLDNIRVYSLDYINKYLLIDPSDRKTIKGLRVVFGEKNIELENEIKKLESKIVSDDKIIELEQEVTQLENETKKEIKKIFDSKKGKVNINNKQASLSSKQQIKEYENDLTNALKLEPNRMLVEQAKGDDSLEKNIVMLKNLKRITFKLENIKNIQLLEETQNKNFDNIEIPNSIIMSWLNEGLLIHVEKDYCEFCGSKIDIKHIKNKINRFQENAKFKAETLYEQLSKTLKQEIENINGVIEETKDNVMDIFEIEEHFINLRAYLESLKTHNGIFIQNAKDILNLKKIDVEEFKTICKKIEQIGNDVNKWLNEKINREEKKLEKIGVLIKGATSIAIKNSTMISKNIAEIESNKVQLFNIKETNKIINNQLMTIKESKIATSDFKNLVNKILKNMNISLELQLVNENYYLKTTLLEKNELTIDDISEGEKNILSLIFFYYEMFEDQEQQELKKEIKLVIMDDPISSLDDSNRFYVLELINSFFDLDIEQIFILTHVWDDYCQLLYNKNSNRNDTYYASYEIKKNDKSIVEEGNSKLSPYKDMFNEIYELSKKRTSLSNCDYYHMPNVMRRVFEEFLLFKIGNTSLAQASKKKQIINDFNIRNMEERKNLGILLRVINVLSHNNIKTEDDIKTSAIFLMRFIKKHDVLHFNSMKKNN